MNGLLMKYFVLNPSKKDEYGRASRNAMLMYALTIKDTNKELATDLRQWVKSIEETEGSAFKTVLEEYREKGLPRWQERQSRLKNPRLQATLKAIIKKTKKK